MSGVGCGNLARVERGVKDAALKYRSGPVVFFAYVAFHFGRGCYKYVSHLSTDHGSEAWGTFLSLASSASDRAASTQETVCCFTNSWSIDWFTTFTDNINSFIVSNNITLTDADGEAKIMAWLSPLEPKVRHQDICNLREDSIGAWLLETKEFRSWCDGSEKHKPDHAALLCYGDPGVGKSYIRYASLRVGGVGLPIGHVVWWMDMQFGGYAKSG
ncbi:hypothetical protein C7212DRAFT_361237 [Tuber magnatum]|uniref:Nephrocystin 3-like N-terminal domain-containing protein n=1 Tax=Tuber magnatum TaxID=42249 RepID=A0A317T1S8_9PEZI|nr:hypothetical protein C7212DRAFT_361237 [Tuber magnatum]